MASGDEIWERKAEIDRNGAQLFIATHIEEGVPRNSNHHGTSQVHRPPNTPQNVVLTIQQGCSAGGLSLAAVLFDTVIGGRHG
jgi:hypothetical protein